MDKYDNESYNLLEHSERSESEIDLPDFINVPKKKKVKRKFRRSHSTTQQTARTNSSCNVWISTVWITTILLTVWIISLTWLALIFHNELQRLEVSFKGVVANSQGVPDALQQCHTVSKNLQQNQTVIAVQIADLKLHMENLSKEVASVHSELNKIHEKFNNAPELMNIPRQISEVSGSVANLGSQIKDLTTTVTVLKDYKSKIEETSSALVQNVTDLQQSLSRLQNLTQAPVIVNNKNNTEIEDMLKVMEELKSNVSIVNTTLSNKLLWVHDDQSKDHKNLDNLIETYQNMSARVTTLQGICGKTSSDQIALDSSVTQLSTELNTLTTNVQNLSAQLPTLQSQIRQLSENSSELETQVKHLTDLSVSPFSLSLTENPSSSHLTDASSSMTSPALNITPTTSANNGKPSILEMT